MDDAAPVPMETLLAHAGWVRGLARSLVRDDATADDVVQDTWATALRSGPRAAEAAPGWLARVVRSRAADVRKAERRRGAREEAAARPEAVGAGHDAAAATEVHRALVAAVMDLEEPYRSAVLLRFFEGLPPREVGARLGIPPETARTRVNRGLEKLRARLDAEHGERRRWRALLVPLVGDAGGPRSGGRRAVTKTLVAAAVVTVTAVTWWAATRAPGGEGDAASAARRGTGAPEPAPARPRGRAARPVASDPAAAPAPEPAAPPVAAAPPAPAGATVRLRFVGDDGAPLPAAVAAGRWSGASLVPTIALFDDRAVRGTTGGNGILQMLRGGGAGLRTVGIDAAAPSPTLAERVPPGRWRVVALPSGAPSSLSRPFVVGPEGGEVTVDVTLRETPLRVVRVLRADGTPAAGARLVPHYEYGDDAAFVAGAAVEADAQGEARLPAQEHDPRGRVRPPTWWATSPGGAASFQVARGDVPLVVNLAPTVTVVGEAYLGDGAPAVGRAVVSRRKGRTIEALCDAEGRFRLEDVPARNAQVFFFEDAVRGIVHIASVRAAKEGVAHVRFGPASVGAAARLTLALTAGGRPLADVPVMVEGGKEAPGRCAVTGADGTVTIAWDAATQPKAVGVLLSDVRVSDDHGAKLQQVPVLAAGADARVALDLPPGVVRVRVLDAQGRPVAGAGVAVRPTRDDAVVVPGWSVRAGGAAFTDDAGVAVIPGLPPAVPCDVVADDEASAATARGQALPGTWDAPAVLELTLAPR